MNNERLIGLDTDLKFNKIMVVVLSDWLNTEDSH